METYTQYLDDQQFVIFLFHGVIPQQRHQVRNYTNKHIVVERFAAILEELRAAGTAVSLPQIVSAHQNGQTLPQHSFAITFDDAFMNNFSVAAPVLRDLQIPATFYVTTGFVDSNMHSWIDLIEYGVEQVAHFRLTSPRFQGEYATPEEKRQLLDRIRQFVKNDPAIDPYAFADDIWQQIGISAMEPDPDLDQKMSWEQVHELSQDNLFTIGGHGHTHRILSYLEPTELEQEIETSLKKLQAHLDSPLEHYSYPEGLAHCYSDEVIEALQRRGIVCAPSAEPGMNRTGDSLFHLKRIMVTE